LRLAQRIRVGAGGAATRPGVAGTVDKPVLHDHAFAVGMGGEGITMPARYLSALRFLIGPERADRLLQGLRAVDRIDGAIAVAVKNDRGDRPPS